MCVFNTERTLFARCYAVLLLFAIVNSRLCLAETPPDTAPTSSQERVILNMIEDAQLRGYTIPEESQREMLDRARQYDRLHSSIVAEGAGDLLNNSPEFLSQLQTPLSRSKGASIVSFPEYVDQVWPPIPTPVTTPESEDSTPDPTPVPYRFPPKNCGKNETSFEPSNSPSSEPEVMLDRIFIPEGLIPLNPEEELGSNIDLVPLPQDSTESVVKTRFEIYEVPCVPYRMRVTNTGTFYHSGHDALKNYDSDPNGKGEWGPVIFARLFPGKRPPVLKQKPRGK